jgi:protein TonB
MSKQRTTSALPDSAFHWRLTMSGQGGKRSLIPEAVLVTLFIHGLAATALLTMDPDRYTKRVLHPLEVTLLTPPQVLRPKPPPPPPPRPKPVVKTEVKPIAPPIEPVVIPDPEPVVSEEPPLPVAPPQEEPTPAPVEVPIVLPEYSADHLRNPAPAYPAIAKRLHIEGTVLVRVLVSPAGLPKKIELARTSGAPVLDEAALKAVQGWAFVPARRGAEPVEAWVEVPINFHLKRNG